MRELRRPQNATRPDGYRREASVLVRPIEPSNPRVVRSTVRTVRRQVSCRAKGRDTMGLRVGRSATTARANHAGARPHFSPSESGCRNGLDATDVSPTPLCPDGSCLSWARAPAARREDLAAADTHISALTGPGLDRGADQSSAARQKVTRPPSAAGRAPPGRDMPPSDGRCRPATHAAANSPAPSAPVMLAVFPGEEGPTWMAKG